MKGTLKVFKWSRKTIFEFFAPYMQSLNMIIFLRWKNRILMLFGISDCTDKVYLTYIVCSKWLPLYLSYGVARSVFVYSVLFIVFIMLGQHTGNLDIYFIHGIVLFIIDILNNVSNT